MHSSAAAVTFSRSERVKRALRLVQRPKGRLAVGAGAAASRTSQVQKKPTKYLHISLMYEETSHSSTALVRRRSDWFAREFDELFASATTTAGDEPIRSSADEARALARHNKIVKQLWRLVPSHYTDFISGESAKLAVLSRSARRRALADAPSNERLDPPFIGGHHVGLQCVTGRVKFLYLAGSE